MTSEHRHTISTIAAGTFLLLCAVLWARPVCADIIYLKAGGALRGEIIEQDEKTITLRVPYGRMIIKRSHVQRIEKEDVLKVLLAQSDGLLKDGKTDAAVAKLEETVRRFPSSVSARERLLRLYHRRAESLHTQGRLLEADRFYRRILELAPDDEEAAEHTRKVDAIRKDAPAAEKEARLLLSFGQYRQALETFNRLAEVVPGSAVRNRRFIARAHAGYGARLLEFKRFAEACSHYNAAVKLDPTLLARRKDEVVIARFSPIVSEINEKGRTLSDARWETLAAELKAIIALDDKNPHFHYALAVCYHELERYAEAAREYAVVTGEKPDLSALPGSLGALQQRAKKKTESDPIILSFRKPSFTDVRPGPTQVLETEHFIIHHHNDEMAVLVARAAEYFLRRNYKVFLDAMPENCWSKKCDVFIYRTHEEYLQQSHQPSWSPAMASTTGIAGQLERHHIMTYQTVEDLTASHLTHEITHIIHGAVVHYHGSNPIWLREGIAVRQEPWFKRMRMARIIREAQNDGKLLTLEQVIEQKGYPPGELVDLFYAQSYALVTALQRSGGKEQFTQFCRQACTAKALAAVKEVYGLDRDELEKRWKKHEADLMSLLDKV